MIRSLLLLVLILLAVYLTTLHPGVDSGDSAELQYMAPLLGVCHPPGYAHEVLWGKLFSHLPLGPNIAWRINFMMAVFGIAGAAALFAALVRITGRILPALVGALTLAFSSIYWTHSLVAEAYVFYASFLLFALYAMVRFVQSGRPFWICLTALFLGVSLGDRPSELFILPAFLAAAFFLRKQVHLHWKSIIPCILLFILPFCVSVAYYLWRSTPDHLAMRDSKLRSVLLSDRYKGGPADLTPPALPLASRIQSAAQLCAGLYYAGENKLNWQSIRRTLDKYAFLLSGRGAWGDRYNPGDPRNAEQGSGVSIGLPALLLAFIAIISQFRRRQFAWISLGLLLFLGNLAFILWHARWDNLTFTIPGLIGLAILTGLGAEVLIQFASSSKRWLAVLLLAAPLFLGFANYNKLDRSTPAEYQRQESLHQLARAPWPRSSAILCSYWPAMTYRYLFFIDAQRPDMQILYEADSAKWPKIIHYFHQRNQPVFVPAQTLPEPARILLQQNFPQPIAEFGFLQIPPAAAAQQSSPH